MNERDNTIDLMRASALVLIILAHTISKETLLFQLRNFDVPMMAVVSGMAFAMSAPAELKLGAYYIRRFLRLLLPCWVFLTLLFCIAPLFVAGDPFSWGQITQSFLLSNKGSIGYVWIIRVFLLVALTAPLLHALQKRVGNTAFVSILLNIYIGYELMLNYMPLPVTTWVRTLVSDYIFFGLGYSVLFGAGMLLNCLQWRGRVVFLLASAAALILCILFKHGFNPGEMGSWFKPQNSKYPPGIYYVQWGLTMSVFTSLVCMKVPLTGRFKTGIAFLGSASLWIYFWHIVVLYVVQWNPGAFSLVRQPGALLFLFVLTASVLLTAGHRFVFGFVATRTQRFPVMNQFLTNAFLK
ncbi:MAG: acyltransferase [Chthoniobacterales bacterium]|nr:acyltransferase [Chthoniobacterales bacterium]